MYSLPFWERNVWEWRQLVNIILSTSFPQKTRKRTIWTGYAPHQHRSTPCLHKQSCRQLNLLASKCANAQLAGTNPASAEDRPFASPPMYIRRADVSCAVIFCVAAGWGEQSCGAGPCSGEVAGGGTRTRRQRKGWWSFGVMEKVSAFSASAAGPQQLFRLQHLKSYNPTLNCRQSSGELLWLLGAAWRGIHAKHKNSTVSVLDLQACI